MSVLNSKQEESIKKNKVVRVLIVEDFGIWQRFIPTILQEDPRYQVIGVSSDGLEGVQKAKELQPDLILMDVGLPKLDGIEAVRRIRRLSPMSQIVFLTENPDPEIVRAAFSAGANGYILKSDAATDLLPGMLAVLLGKKFVSYNVPDIDVVDSGE